MNFDTEYKVTVVITTYNLEDYIGQCLESVLSQNVNFKYKVIIADDSSNDNTLNIINKFQLQYKDKIDLITSKRNQGSLSNSNKAFEKVNTQYFTFLDGDDYWIGNNRLQKQVDFLENHPDYTMCGGNTHYLIGNKISGLVIKKELTGKSYSFEQYLKKEVPFVHTSSLLVRNVIFYNGVPKYFKDAEKTFENCALRGEDFRRIIHLEKGKMHILNETLSVYRIHSKGIWQGSTPIKRKIEQAIAKNYYRKFFKDRYGEFFEKDFINAYKKMMKSLIIDNNIASSFNLTKEETYLLTSLFLDLDHFNGEGKLSRFKKKALRMILK